MSYPAEDVKCWGLLRTTALEPGVEAPSVIRTLILRTCLQTPDMSKATGLRAMKRQGTKTQSGKVVTWVWIPLSSHTPGRSSTHCRNLLSQLSSKHLKVKPDLLYVLIWYLQLLLNSLTSSSFLVASLQFSMYSIMSPINSDRFTSFLICIPFIYLFFNVIAMAKTSKTMLNNNDKNGHPVLFLVL